MKMSQTNLSGQMESSSSSSSIQSFNSKRLNNGSNGKSSSQPKEKLKGKNKNRNINTEKEVTRQLENQLNFSSKKGAANNKRNQISLNHLLHYESYKELDEYKTRQASKPKRSNNNSINGNGGTNGGDGRRGRRSFGDYSPDRYKVPLTGMGFINLNYKFIVDYKGNYKPQELDPNVPVEKDNIIRIIVPKGNSCPICLSDEPIAPRMITACGHILCLKCLLSMLDTEIPSFKKKESLAIIEKYKECPLCSNIIRKNECKPVLINNFDERFEIPKIGSDVVMTLMSRPYNKLFSVPKHIENIHYQIKNFPSVDLKEPDLSNYLRLFKADLKYILDMYNDEKKKILQTYEEEKLLYNEDIKYTLMAIDEINKDIDTWSNKYNETNASNTSGGNNNNSNNNKVEIESIVKNEEMNSSNSFFYYQTGFNNTSIFVLSPLDIKVLKTNYNNDYSQLPNNVIIKIENIQYEELTPENSIKKYKYLSHLPLGTSIGFIQCNWFKNEFISEDTWSIFKNDLIKRSKKTNQKFIKEDRDKRRAQQQEERRTKMFYERENNQFHNPTNHRSNNYLNDEYYYYNDNNIDNYHYENSNSNSGGNLGGLTIVDNRELPSLTGRSESDEIESEPTTSKEYETTVWGTKIRKSENAIDDEFNDELEAEEMIRKAREAMDKASLDDNSDGKNTNKKKKKKKLILLSSTSNYQ